MSVNSENANPIEEGGLDRLFQRYRSACPEGEGSSGFMPSLWQKIEARQSFWAVFQHFGKTVTTASAAICLLLLVLNLIASPAAYDPAATYADALMAEHTAEKTYYGEAIRNSQPGEDSASEAAH